MTKSTLLLFKLIRWRLAIGMAVAFLAFLFMAFFQPSLDKEYLPLLPLVGVFLALLMGLHSLLGNTMFPVSDRQLAWIPMVAWGLTGLSGMAGLLAGQLFLYAQGWIVYQAIPAYWLHLIPAISPVLFLILLFWRAFWMSPGALGFIGFGPMLVLSHDKSNLYPPGFHELFMAGWPVWTLGCIFLVWEAPRQTSVLRRLATMDNNQGWYKFNVPQLNGPTRKSLPTYLADSMLMILGLVILFPAIDKGFSGWSNSITNFHVNLYLLIPLFFLLGVLRDTWRYNRASGMSAIHATGVLLLEMTGVGYALRDLFGVARGEKVRCGLCGNWRMVWQEACPHCGDGRQKIETLSTTCEKQKPGLGAILWPRHDPSARAYRCMVPLYILGFMFALNWRHWFGG